MKHHFNRGQSCCLRALLCLTFLLIVGLTSRVEASCFPGEKRERIELNQLVEVSFPTSRNHEYEIHLVKGQFVQITLSSELLWLQFSITPGGEYRESADYAVFSPSNLVISLIAPETGCYKIAVEVPSNPNLTAGAYRLQATVLPNPLPEFFIRAKAQRMKTEVHRLYYREKSRESFLKITEIGEEAARLFGQLGKQLEQADVLNMTGEAWRQLGESAKAIEAFERALEHGVAAGAYSRAAEALTFIGMCWYQLSDYQRAIESHQQALQMWKTEAEIRPAPTNMLAWTSTQLGEAYTAMGQTQQALEIYESAAARYKQNYDANPDAKAEREWHFGAAFGLRGKGRVYAQHGEKQKALDALTDAVEHYKKAGDAYYKPILLNELGALYASLGEHEQARQLYEQALKLSPTMGNRSPESQTRYLIGQLFQAAGHFDKAVNEFAESLQIRRELKDRRGQAFVLNGLGEVYAARRDYQQALGVFEEALAIQREIGDRYGEGGTLANLGAIRAELGEINQARVLLKESLTLRRSLNDREGEANALFHLARLAQRCGQLPEARRLIETALQQVELIRGTVLSQELRASYLGTMRDYYELYIDLLMQLHQQHSSEGHELTALRASEMARARSLLDSLAEARVNIRSDVDAKLLARERQLQQQMQTIAETELRQIQQGTNLPSSTVALTNQLNNVKSQYQAVQAQIRATSPRYAALTQPQPLSASEIMNLLDDETTLLEYSLGKERSYVWLVTNKGVSSYALPRRETINAAARRMYELLTARNRKLPNETPAERRRRIANADVELPEATRELSRIVLAPVASQLKTKRLVVVAQEGLQFIPFAILPKAVAFNPLMIADHEISYLPSASTLALLRQHENPDAGNRQSAKQELAILADPVFNSNDARVTSRLTAPSRSAKPAQKFRGWDDLQSDAKSDAKFEATRFRRLPATQHEADQISSLVKSSERLLATGFAANRALATSAELNRFRILHFATHALIHPEHVELSGLVLSLVDEQGQAQDGFLSAQEIYNLQLSADLVVLSACKTWLGKEVRGEGLVGMTRSFMQAGASRVVVSLWSQQDNSTASLMVSFYRKLLADKSLSPSAALRAAQLEMLKSGRWPSPYFWAGFTLQGEYR